MGSISSNIILVNPKSEILLQLRDDIPTILYPNTWTLPGGHKELEESPEQCILREIDEELGLGLPSVQLFMIAEWSYGVEFTFWAKASFQTENIKLTEGQCVRWFNESEAKKQKLGYEDSAILKRFFEIVNGTSLVYSLHASNQKTSLRITSCLFARV